MTDFHLLRCAICERALLIGADKDKKFSAACPTCNILTPISEILANASVVTFGNHLKGQGKDKPSKK